MDEQKEMSLTRLLHAPRELVFKMWTDPEHLKHWWGPDGFTNTITVMDVRPGGHWSMVMHGPDGTDYPNEMVFVGVVKPELIVFDHVSWPNHRTTVKFEAQGDKTLVTMQMLFKTAEDRASAISKHKADIGMIQHGDRMQAYIEKQTILTE